MSPCGSGTGQGRGCAARRASLRLEVGGRGHVGTGRHFGCIIGAGRGVTAVRRALTATAAVCAINTLVSFVLAILPVDG